MVNKAKSFTDKQSDIFQQLETPPEEAAFTDGVDLDNVMELRGAMATALKNARRRGITRERVVEEMNRFLPELPKHKRITLRKINAWMAASQEDKEFPARFISAFCAATQCNLPARVIAQTINMDISDPRELMAQEFGEIEIQRAILAKRATQLKNSIGGG